MTDLERRLAAARSANPGERIQWRDPIASYGRDAIPWMAEWLDDPKLGSFAVRVLERIANEPSHRRYAIAALQDADLPSTAPAARHIADALNRIPGGTARGRRGEPGATPSRTEQWPSDRDVTALELRFHDAMLDVYRRAGEATRRRRPDGTFERGYWATYFLRGVRRHGGPAYAKQLLRKQGTTAGFQRLKEERRLDISMEALVLEPDFAPLFSVDELRIAEQRLRAAGFDPDHDRPQR